MDQIDLDFKEPLGQALKTVREWINDIFAMLPNMAVALLLVVIFFLLASLGRKLFQKVFNRASKNSVLENLFATVVYYSILFVGLFIVLEILNLSKAVTSLLAGIGIVGLALGFAFQDIAANFVSGVILAFRRPFLVGHVVSLNDTMGMVKGTNLRVTMLTTFQGQIVYIPNKEVLENAIVNYSVLGKRRIDISVGVSYGDDLEKVEKLVREVILNMEGVIDHDKLIFDYYEFGDSSINFHIRFWIKYAGQPEYWDHQNRAIKAIKAAFDENDITIPFPIRTLDFGIKGGEKLSEMALSIVNRQSPGGSINTGTVAV